MLKIDALLVVEVRQTEISHSCAILFPHVNSTTCTTWTTSVRSQNSRTTKLKRSGLAPEDIEDIVARRDQLPNLMLLGVSTNTAKSAKSPADWLAQQGDDSARSAWRDRNALPFAASSGTNRFQ